MNLTSRIQKFSFIALAIFSQSTLAHENSWQAINQGIKGTGYITAVAVHEAHPNEIWTAAFNNNLYRSNDNAKTWQSVSAETFNNTFITSITFDPKNLNTMYISTLYNGLYKSADHAQTWNKLTNGLPDTSMFTSIAVDPINPMTMYVTTDYKGVFKSYNGGENWFQIDKSIEKQFSYLSINVNPLNTSHLLLVTLNGNNFGPNVYQSLDAGLHWNLLTVPAYIYRVAFSPTSSQQIFGGGRGGLYRSDDLGKTWVNIFKAKSENKILNSILINKTKSNEMYIYMEGEGIYKTIDQGQNWQLINNKHVGDEWTTLLLDNRTQSLFFTTDNSGLWRSTDEGSNWSSSSDGIVNIHITTLAVDPSNKEYFFAGTEKHGLWLMQDGKTWTQGDPQFSQSDITQILIDQQNSSHIVMIADQKIYFSHDKGQTWQTATIVGDEKQHFYPAWLTANQLNPQEILAGGHDGTIWKSVDGGTTWNVLSQVDPHSLIVGTSALVINPKNPKEMYVGIIGPYGQLIYKSIDAGKTWQLLPYSFGGNAWGRDFNYLQSMAIDPQNPNVLYASALVGNTSEYLHLYKSTDAGLHWTQQNLSLPVTKISAIVLDPIKPSTLYIATEMNHEDMGGDGVYISKNGGSDWTSFNDGLTNNKISALLLNQNHLYAGTGGAGVFTRDLSGVVNK